jgi:hypothetical protein
MRALDSARRPRGRPRKSASPQTKVPTLPSWRDRIKAIARKPRGKRDRGVPPPLTFDLNALADGTLLSQAEAAAALRRSISCLENWRQHVPDHPLKRRRVQGRITYTAGNVRAVIEAGD